MNIYAHIGINPEVLNEKYEQENDFGEVVTYTINYDKKLIVNMPFVGDGEKKANAQGWLRDSRFYFKEMLNKNPEFFSKHNIELISQGRSPYCDKVFISHFPEYEMYLGNKLIHHHIGRDGQAVAIPEDIHVGQGGVHLAETKIGINANALKFSESVSCSVKNGEEFLWDDAIKHIDCINKDLVKSAEQDNERKQVIPKEHTDKIIVSRYTNLQAPVKKTSSLLEKVVRIINKIPAPVKTGGKIVLALVVAGVAVAAENHVLTKEMKSGEKNDGGKYENEPEVDDYSEEEADENDTEDESKGSPKSPHDRCGYPRTLANGKQVQVKATRVHKELD